MLLQAPSGSSHGKESLSVTLRRGKGLAGAPEEATLLPSKRKLDALDEALLAPD